MAAPAPALPPGVFALGADNLQRPAADGVSQALILPDSASEKDRTPSLQRPCDDTLLDFYMRRRQVDPEARDFLEKLPARHCSVVLSSKVSIGNAVMLDM